MRDPGFPDSQPSGYDLFNDEPVFDPVLHLQLEDPEEVLLLTDLGYSADEVATKATPIACSSPFRVLSDDGAAVLLSIARRLREFCSPAPGRIENMVRGGCYRSAWLRALCTSPEVTAHLEEIWQIEIVPHLMPVHLGHLNFEPSQIDRAIDRWHHDTLPLDYVLTVTDPGEVKGGRFQWFRGTKHEAADLAARGETPSPDRTVVPDFPGPGHAIALHGDMVVHRASPLDELSERITMVNGYVAANTTADEQSRSRDLIVVDDPDLLYAEWSRLAAWRSASRLQAVVQNVHFNADPEVAADRLEAAVAEVLQAAQEMRAGAVEMEHYEQS